MHNMLVFIKKTLPQPVKKVLLSVKKTIFDEPSKKLLFYRMEKKHRVLIARKKGKERIRVVFLVTHRSVWKVDSIFKKMLSEPFFEPIILVCPYTVYGDERMRDEMGKTIEYFKEKNYPTISSYNNDKKVWLELPELYPDLVFFTNPHKLTRKEYYQDAYLNYLSCYVPYHHEVGSYGGNVAQYNGYFHNAMWKIFSSQQSSYDLFKNFSANRARNVIVTGYPAMEDLYSKIISSSYNDVWKSKCSKIRIIWAPHHTIDSPELPYSNFLKYAESMKDLVRLYDSKVIWAFKPHPILKSKLYNHKDWGVEKTNDYYSFWESDSRTQLEESEYVDLFCSSDALIHDSGSFLAEYLYTKKPVLYMMSDNNSHDFYSKFGVDALKATRKGYNLGNIISFIDSVISDKNKISDEYNEFYAKEIEPFFISEKPSERILKIIRDSIL